MDFRSESILAVYVKIRFFCFKVNLNQRGVGVKVLLEFSDVFNLFHFFNLLFWWCTQNYGLISWFFWATKSGNSSTDHQDTKCRNNPKSIDHNVSSVPNERVTVIDLGGPFIYYVSIFPGYSDPSTLFKKNVVVKVNTNCSVFTPFPNLSVNAEKFIYSEKATKSCEIFPLLLTTVKSKEDFAKFCGLLRI